MNSNLKKGLVFLSLALATTLGACATKPKTTESSVVTTPATNTEAAATTNTDSNGFANYNFPKGGDNQNTNANSGSSVFNASAELITKVNNQIIQIGSRVYFDTDSYSISEQARTTLSEQAKILVKNKNVKILIDGNCDERGTREYNLALGARRANAAKDYLVSLGVPPEQIETVSYGKERPIDARPSAEGWAINRNAHTSATAN